PATTPPEPSTLSLHDALPILVGKAREARSRASAAEHALGTMSHEIRSPLSAIIRYSEALRTDHMSNLTAAQRAGIAQINADAVEDRKSTRLNSSHVSISYAVF